MPKWVNLEQGSEGWHKWRNEGVGASDAATIMGERPSIFYCSTWDDLRKRQDGLLAPPTEEDQRIMDHGKAYEAEARAMLEALYNYPFEPRCAEASLDDRVRASFDGVAQGFPHHRPQIPQWIEIKCPATATSPYYKYGKRTDRTNKAWWQIVHQAFVLFSTGDKDFYQWCNEYHFCTFFVYYPDGNTVISEISVKSLLGDWQEYAETLRRFWNGDWQGKHEVMDNYLDFHLPNLSAETFDLNILENEDHWTGKL